ncbi:MAG: hypothetical protein PCFJNLEI_03239 [Verrucomicrobiae bacterium]|nr:hypothetical protein [Verrucomicrobiae bacterium]
MADVFFKCRACEKHLVVDEQGVGTTINCPGCQTAIVVPTVLLVHSCPHCHDKIKSAAEMKGELVDCPGCGKEFAVPGAQPGTPPLVAYICPACQAEVEAPEQVPDQTSPCPRCGAQVHFRRKLRLKSAEPVTILPTPNRWRRVVALVILVAFAGLVTAVFLRIHAALQQ